jgi:hypothetical protein
MCIKCLGSKTYEGVSRSFRTGRLRRELDMVHLSATRCSCIAIFLTNVVSFAAIILYVASQRVCVVISLSTQSGNFWIHHRNVKMQVVRSRYRYDDKVVPVL